MLETGARLIGSHDWNATHVVGIFYYQLAILFIRCALHHFGKAAQHVVSPVGIGLLQAHLVYGAAVYPGILLNVFGDGTAGQQPFSQ